MEKYIEDFLQNNKINYILHKHPPVFTVEESKIHCKNIPGLHLKNLFLKEKTGEKYFLVTMSANERLNIKKLVSELEASRGITFANEKELFDLLKLKPGSVSPLGMINEKGKEVFLIVDKRAWDAETTSFHPNQNDESLEVKQQDFHNLIKSFNCKFSIIKLE